MRFEFDANQTYQREAIDAVVRLFEGQSRVQANLEFSGDTNFAAVPNRLDLGDNQVRLNLAQVIVDTGVQAFDWNGFFNFSVEMETGTGKTYIYLRTALELFQQYGMRKFIVVVPSVAIREGVLKTLQMTEAHFKKPVSECALSLLRLRFCESLPSPSPAICVVGERGDYGDDACFVQQGIQRYSSKHRPVARGNADSSHSSGASDSHPRRTATDGKRFERCVSLVLISVVCLAV